MKILSITAQKPHSTGSGTYMTELVRSFARAGHGQAVVCGIYPDDEVSFPDGVACFPVYFTDTAREAFGEPSDSADGSIAFSAQGDREEAPVSAGGPYAHAVRGDCEQTPVSADASFASAEKGPLVCADEDADAASPDRSAEAPLPFPIVGMSDIMPYTSTRYRDLTPDMVRVFEDAFIEAVSQAVGELDPDLIICHHLFLLTALVRKHFPERRIFGISHGTDLRQMVNCDNLRELVRPEIARLDMCLALHESQAGTIKEIFGLNDDRVRVIGSGYNGALFNTEGRAARRAGDPVRICYAGKISRPKGVPELLEALERICRRTKPVAEENASDARRGADQGIAEQAGGGSCCAAASERGGSHGISGPAGGVFAAAEHSQVDCGPRFELVMAGGCQDEVLKARLDRLPPYVRYAGQIPQQELAGLLRGSDLFILPSFFEGLPLVLIEAMASGAVPISTDLPGVRDWIDANVSGSNVKYVPMPEMKSIDEPTEAGRLKFIDNLERITENAIMEIASRGSAAPELPDTGGITWDRLACRIPELSIQTGCRKK